MKNLNSRLLVSFSGGRTSAFMLKYLLNNYDGELCVVFANTGKEKEETLEFVNHCSIQFNVKIHWIEYNPLQEHGKKNWYKVVDFKTASRNGEPFEKFINKERIPNMAYPNCSGRLKVLPIHNFIKHEIGWDNYSTAIGIRFDEKQRINWIKAKKENLVYPLATDFPVNENFIREWWSQQSFDLGIKDYQGNCDFCWKKSDRKLITLIREGLDVSWWKEMESKSEYNFFRGDKSVDDLIEMAKDKRIRSVTDKKELNDNQGKLFDPLDLGSRCTCNF